MIERNFERKFILRFAGILIAGAVLNALFLYLALPKQEITCYADSVRSCIEAKRAMPPAIMKAYIIESIMAPLIVILVALFTSHKIAGPIFRIRTVLSQMATTLGAQPIVLRHDDQLQGAAISFNRMLKGLDDRLTSVIDAYEETERAGKGLDGTEESMATLKAKVDGLDKTLEKFNV